MVDIQSAAADIRRGKKKEIYMVSLLHRATIKKEDRNHRAKILWPALLYRAAIINKVVATRWTEQPFTCKLGGQKPTDSGQSPTDSRCFAQMG